MRPARRPRGVACTSVRPMSQRARATVDTGNERRVRRGIDALFDGIGRQLGMLATAMHSTSMRLTFAALACGALVFAAAAQSPPDKAPPKPAPTAAATAPAKAPAAETAPKIPYPEWLFPIDDETKRAARLPPPKTPTKDAPKLDD